MNIKFPWNKKSDDEPINVSSEPRAEKMPIDFGIQREMLMLPLSGKPGPCPRCGGALQQTYATYVIATRRGTRMTDAIMAGGDLGWFCLNCPTLVINESEVNHTLGVAGGRWDIGTEFVVMGIVNLDAIPESKKHIPLGDDGNPIPLVEFTSYRAMPGRGEKARRKSKKQRRRR